MATSWDAYLASYYGRVSPVRHSVRPQRSSSKPRRTSIDAARAHRGAGSREPARGTDRHLPTAT